MLLQFCNINSRFSLASLSHTNFSFPFFTLLFIKAPDVRIYGYLFFSPLLLILINLSFFQVFFFSVNIILQLQKTLSRETKARRRLSGGEK